MLLKRTLLTGLDSHQLKMAPIPLNESAAGLLLRSPPPLEPEDADEEAEEDEEEAEEDEEEEDEEKEGVVDVEEVERAEEEADDPISSLVSLELASRAALICLCFLVISCARSPT